MKTLYLLDGHSLAYRAFFALPLELQTKNGLHTNAVLGFTNMLLRLMEEKKPECLAVAFDYPGPTFRHRQYEPYKATREKTPDELREQIPVIKELIQGFQIPTYELEGYEADDLIGTFASRAEQAGMKVMIVTADADVYQLLSAHVSVLITRKGLSELEEYNQEKLREQYGLTPAQWIDYKALKGDSSDNVPGVPGIGEKRAVQLLARYGSLETLVQHGHEIPGKIGKSLLEHAGQAFLSRDLVRILRDAPIPFQLQDIHVDAPDWEKLLALFTRLEFRALIEKIPALALKHPVKNGGEAQGPMETRYLQPDLFTAGEQQDSVLGEDEDGERKASSATLSFTEEAPGDLRYTRVATLQDLDACLQKLKASPLLALFPRESGPREARELQEIALAARSGDVYLLSFEAGGLTAEDFLRALQPILANPEPVLVTHDLKILMKWFLRFHLSPACKFFDTLLAAYLIDPDRPSFSLPLLTGEYLGLTLAEPGKKAAEETKREQQQDFLVRGCRSILDLKESLDKQLKLRQLQNLFSTLELPLVRVLAKMELYGIRVQESVLTTIGQAIDTEMRQVQEEIYNLVGARFNLNSPKQLSQVLFEKLNLPTGKKIKTGYSTDSQVLEELAGTHPIARWLLKFRTLSKIKNTYLEGLRPLINPHTGKIHTTFNQAVTATGRLSSSDPNLQNIPIRLEEGRRLRQAFTPSTRDRVLLAADYSQIELRLLAHLSQDPNLLDAFNRGQDIHRRTASEVFGVPLEDVTPLMRNRAKAVNFGIIYGISDYGLARDLKISRAEARDYIDHYFRRHPGVQAFVEECINLARKNGYVTTVMKRRRYLVDINHAHYNRRSFAERMARNTPIQGSAADLIKAAMIAIDRRIEAEERDLIMLLQVHDELIFELIPGELEEAAALIQEEMEGVYPLSVPLRVDLRVGQDWYHMYSLERK